MITAISTTRDRPLCFSLLEQWVAAQTVKPDQWLVVNDTYRPASYAYTMQQEVIHRKRKKVEGLSICENWQAAIPRIKGDVVVVLEDDDYYHPSYIETLSAMLEQAEVAGFTNDVYYNLRLKRFHRRHNVTDCALAATGFRSSLLPRLKEIATRQSVYLDLPLWDEGDERKLTRDNKAPDGLQYHVGLKGMPGLAGLGNGHGADGSTDPTGQVLRQWVGMEAARVYLSLPASAWGGA